MTAESANDPLRVFVIMPFDPEFQPIYDQLIRPPLEEAGFEVLRADSFLNQQNILRDIVRGIALADLVVAEISTLNANVFYELGLAHGLGVRTIMLAQSMEQVPFDLRAYRVLVYSTLFSRTQELKEALNQVAVRVRTGEIAFSSPVSDFLPDEYQPPDDEGDAGSGNAGGARPRHPASGPATPATAAADEEIAEDEGPRGFLDFIVEGEETIEQLGGLFAIVATSTEEMAERIQHHAARISAVVEGGGPGTASRIQQIALEVAADMDEYSSTLEQRQPDLDQRVGDLTEIFGGYVNWIAGETEEERQQIIELQEGLSTLLEGTRGGLEGFRSLQSSTAAARGISRVIDRAATRMASALGRVIESMERVEAFCARTLQVIEDKLRQEPEEK